MQCLLDRTLFYRADKAPSLDVADGESDAAD
jgi:hypothetical protein